ncbi:MAG: hypothetical protein WDN76_05020 [Alphaproteobacteria bacterium]
MLFVLCLLELCYRVLLFAMVWAIPLCCAVAAAYAFQHLHLSNPLAILWAFVGAALAGRFVGGWFCVQYERR